MRLLFSFANGFVVLLSLKLALVMDELKRRRKSLVIQFLFSDPSQNNVLAQMLVSAVNDKRKSKRRTQLLNCKLKIARLDMEILSCPDKCTHALAYTLFREGQRQKITHGHW